VTLIDDIAHHMQSNLLVGQDPLLVMGVSLFGGVLPEKPTRAVALLESTSVAPIEMMGGDTGPSIERPRLQILVRDSSYANARDLVQSVYSFLQRVTMTDIQGTLYHRIASVDMPELISRDERQYPIFSCNFDVWKELSS